MRRPRTLLAMVALPLAGCGAAAATRASAAPAATSAPAVVHVLHATRAAAAAAPVDRFAAMAMRQYTRETSGSVARADLRQISREPGLRAAARSGNVATLRAYVNQRFPTWYHQHVSRLQILRGPKTIVDMGVPFVVDGPHVTLPGGDTLRISIQDEIGFVRLLHRHNPVEVVVRGQGAGHVRSSLPAATNAALPTSGRVTIAGLRYDVRSFSSTALGGEPVRIWILKRG